MYIQCIYMYVYGMEEKEMFVINIVSAVLLL